MNLASILTCLILFAKVMCFVVIDALLIAFTAIIIAASIKCIMSIFRRNGGKTCIEE